MNYDVILDENKKALYPDKEYFFRPSQRYPENKFSEISDNKNYIYDMVRNLFILRQYDKENIGTESWNPLGEIIKPGNKVVIKPNLVMDVNLGGAGEECLYTHPSVIAPIIDYTIIALKGKGEIIVGDAPMQECDFEKLIYDSGYKQLIEFYQNKGINIILKDFRGVYSIRKNGLLYTYENDKTEEIIVDLKDESEFETLTDNQIKNLRITNYDPRQLNLHQKRGKHEYAIAKDLITADVIINVPKPKTHRKAGVTISLKNMIGGNCRKEYLPHHMNGDAESGIGDEYRKKNYIKVILNRYLDKINIARSENRYLYAKIYKIILEILYGFKGIQKDKTFEGSWSGNCTISKTIIDINKILMYAKKDGSLSKTPQRKMLIIADMIISGEKDGPLRPLPKKVNVLAMGENQYSFDKVIALLMGCKIDKLATLNQADASKSSLKINCDKEIKIISNNKLNGKNIAEIKSEDKWYFEPIEEWKDIFYEN